jgi:hypothetical protein
VPVTLAGPGVEQDSLQSLVELRGDGYRIEGAGRSGIRVYRGARLVSETRLEPLVERLRGVPPEEAWTQSIPADSLRLDWRDAEGVFSLRLSHVSLTDTSRSKARVRHLSGVLLIAPATKAAGAP